jgi:hypothetical protein
MRVYGFDLLPAVLAGKENAILRQRKHIAKHATPVS